MTEKELSADIELLKRGLKMGKYILKQDAISVLVNEVKTHNNPVKRAYTRAAALIEQIKAEDVQSIKHGQWSECYTDTHHYSGICSVCGKGSIKSLTESLYVFCPKCGARMDGALNE